MAFSNPFVIVPCIFFFSLFRLHHFVFCTLPILMFLHVIVPFWYLVLFPLKCLLWPKALAETIMNPVCPSKQVLKNWFPPKIVFISSFYRGGCLPKHQEEAYCSCQWVVFYDITLIVHWKLENILFNFPAYKQRSFGCRVNSTYPFYLLSCLFAQVVGKATCRSGCKIYCLIRPGPKLWMINKLIVNPTFCISHQSCSLSRLNLKRNNIESCAIKYVFLFLLTDLFLFKYRF